CPLGVGRRGRRARVRTEWPARVGRVGRAWNLLSSLSGLVVVPSGAGKSADAPRRYTGTRRGHAAEPRARNRRTNSSSTEGFTCPTVEPWGSLTSTGVNPSQNDTQKVLGDGAGNRMQPSSGVPRTSTVTGAPGSPGDGANTPLPGRGGRGARGGRGGRY